jgi:tetratricopeptide (TPR) repeat protein
VGELPDGGSRLRFAHVLIRDAVYEDLPATRRLRLHREIGETLERLYAGNLEPHLAELAHHYLLAGAAGAEKAVRYAAAAGDRAASQLAFEEAARHYRSALGLLETGPSGDEDQTCDLLLSLGDVLHRAGRGSEAKAALRHAADIAERNGWAERLARAAQGYSGRFAWARASTDPALVPLLERGLAAVGEGDSPARVRLLARLAAATRDDRARERRVRVGEEAVEIATRVGDPATLAYALEGYWVGAEGPDNAEELLAVGERLIGLAEQIGEKEMVFAARDHRLNTLWSLTDRAAVDVEIALLAGLADELRQPAQQWSVGTDRTMLALMEGDFERAERLIAETLATGRQAESWNALVSQRLALFVLRRAQGRLAELEELIGRSVHEYPPLMRFRCALAHLYSQLGRERDARATFDDLLSRDLAREHVDAEWLFSIVLLADPCAFLGDEGAAATLYSLLLPYERRYAQAPVEVSFGSVARGLGVLATTLQRFDDAEGHFAVALEIERRMRARPWLANTQHDLATMSLARGDLERAREQAAEAIHGYRELGMETWAERAQALATDAGRATDGR